MSSKNINIGVILAGGLGRRLDIFETPKPLVKVGGETLIMRSVKRYEEMGVENIVIVIRKYDSLIKKELFEKKNITYIEIDHDANMISAMKSISTLIDSGFIANDFFVSMCDLVFQESPLSAFTFEGDVEVLVGARAMYGVDSGATVHVHLVDGKLIYEDTGSTGLPLYEAGLYRLSLNGYFDLMGFVDDTTRTCSDVLAKYGNANDIFSAEFKHRWFDINLPVDLIRAESFLCRNVGVSEDHPTPSYTALIPSTVYDYDKKLRFDVVIERGILDHIDQYEIIPHESFYSPHYIVVDRNIDKFYGENIYKQFKGLGYRIEKILVDPGENTKSISEYIRLADYMISQGIDKKSIIMSVGGGVVKDLAGFLASTIYRGIGFVSFPTTVLSQSDAAIALKQGVNGTLGKNMLGSYYSPLKVIVDPATLMTLEDKYVYDGLAECLKQAFAQDVDFYTFFDEYNGEIKNLDFLEEVVRRASTLKVDSISQDYDEEKIALVNQYGHEVGHAVEHLSGYRLLHGESVAIGMRVSAELSRVLGICDDDTVEKQIAMLQKYNLPHTIPDDIDFQAILDSMKFSKKYHGNQARFVLVDRIGSIWHNDNYYFVTCNDIHLEEAIRRSYATLDISHIVQSEYGIHPTKVDEITMGVVNTNYLVNSTEGLYLFKQYNFDSQEQVAYELSILTALALQQFPCPYIHPLLNAQTYGTSMNNKQYALFTYIPGEILSSATEEQLHDVGVLLGRMHVILQDLKQSVPKQTWEYNDIVSFVDEYAGSVMNRNFPNVNEFVSYIRNEISQMNFDVELPIGTTHQDVKPENIIVDSDGQLHFIDFNNCYRGILLFDVMTPLIWMAFNNGIPQVNLITSFLKGYQSIRSFTDSEKKYFFDALRFRLLREAFVWPMRWFDGELAVKYGVQFFESYKYVVANKMLFTDFLKEL